MPEGKKRGHRPPYEVTEQARQVVKIMVAGGMRQLAIAAALGISEVTLRKYFKREIAAGSGEADAAVIGALHKMAVGQRAKPAQTVNGVHYHAQSEVAPNVHAAKWWTQARMGWSERIIVDDGKPADTPMRVVVEFVGEAAPVRAEQSAPRTGSRLADEIRKTVQLVG